MKVENFFYYFEIAKNAERNNHIMNNYNYYPYFNAYGNPYGSYYTYQNQPQQNMNNYYQQQVQSTNKQQIYLPLTYVKNLKEAQDFIVNANQAVFLKDDENKILYEKKTDSIGKSYLTPYKLIEISIEDIDKKYDFESVTAINKNYLTKDDLKVFEDTIIQKISFLLQQNQKEDMKNE